MKITLDTNVLISALINNGKSRILLFEIIRGNHGLILSKETLAEFAETSHDPKIRRYVSEAEIERFLRNLANVGRILRIKSDFTVVLEDPDDDIILRTARDGRVSYLVSGDKHLLKLKNFMGIRIITVDEMLRILRGH